MGLPAHKQGDISRARILELDPVARAVSLASGMQGSQQAHTARLLRSVPTTKAERPCHALLHAVRYLHRTWTPVTMSGSLSRDVCSHARRIRMANCCGQLQANRKSLFTGISDFSDSGSRSCKRRRRYFTMHGNKYDGQQPRLL